MAYTKKQNNRRYYLHGEVRKAGYPLNARTREVLITPEQSDNELPPPIEALLKEFQYNIQIAIE
ncbi:MAG: hypothetical protein LBP67_05135 [Bacteroidales bacterium]|jgi:hypothetical protein|nr:hypothetical protein [Bacteroidales bacterium]